jgi:hypothetical protein
MVKIHITILTGDCGGTQGSSPFQMVLARESVIAIVRHCARWVRVSAGRGPAPGAGRRRARAGAASSCCRWPGSSRSSRPCHRRRSQQQQRRRPPDEQRGRRESAALPAGQRAERAVEAEHAEAQAVQHQGRAAVCVPGLPVLGLLQPPAVGVEEFLVTVVVLGNAGKLLAEPVQPGA